MIEDWELFADPREIDRRKAERKRAALPPEVQFSPTALCRDASAHPTSWRVIFHACSAYKPGHPCIVRHLHDLRMHLLAHTASGAAARHPQGLLWKTLARAALLPYQQLRLPDAAFRTCKQACDVHRCGRS